MSSSELGHYVRFDEALVEGSGGTNDFVDTALHRRALGNLDHLADQYCQILVNWPAPAGNYFTIDTASIANDTYYRMWTSAAFDMAVRSDGESYRCRCRLRLSSNSALVSATFRAVIAQEGASEPELYEAGANVATFVVTSATSSWQSAASLLYLDGARVARARRQIAQIDSIGGAPINATWLRAQLVVYGQRDTASAEPRLYGAHLAQYLPP